MTVPPSVHRPAGDCRSVTQIRGSSSVMKPRTKGKRSGDVTSTLYPMSVSARIFSPRAFGGDGLRWHLRAYNWDAERFEDLLFPRMVEMGSQRPAGTLPKDEDWERLVEVRLRPASRLSPGQQAVVAADYMMQGLERTVEVRTALLFLFLHRIGVDRPGALLELSNAAEVRAELTQTRRR